MSKQGESTPGVPGSIVHGSQGDSELVDEFQPSRETATMVVFASDGGISSSSGTEVQGHEGSVNGWKNNDDSSIFRQEVPAKLLGCGPELMKSHITAGVTPCPSGDTASLSESEFLDLLIACDPSSLELPAFLDAYLPITKDIDLDYSKTEIGGSDYNLSLTTMNDDVIMVEPAAVSETQGAPPLMEDFIPLSERSSLISNQAEFAVPDGGSATPCIIHFNNGCTPAENESILAVEKLHRTNDWGLDSHPVVKERDPKIIGWGASSSSNSAAARPYYSDLWAQSVPPPVIPDSSLAGSSTVPTLSMSGNIYRIEAERSISWLDAQGRHRREENTVGPCIREQPQPGRKLLIEKELTRSDLGINVSSVKLPKEMVERCIGSIPVGSQGLAVTFHDAVEANRTWIMRFTVLLKTVGANTRRGYALKDSSRYLRHHALKEGDWLQIWKEAPDDRYIVTFEKNSAEYCPPSHPRHLSGMTWTLIARKTLSESETFIRSPCVGSIGLEKKKIERHFPQMGNNGLEVTFFDWEFDCTWKMTVRFSLHNNSRTYRLEGTTDFCKTHGLKKDDYLVIYKSGQPHASYALGVCKIDRSSSLDSNKLPVSGQNNPIP